MFISLSYFRDCLSLAEANIASSQSVFDGGGEYERAGGLAWVGR
jgi:hypothetical protein